MTDTIPAPDWKDHADRLAAALKYLMDAQNSKHIDVWQSAMTHADNALALYERRTK